MLFRAIGWRGRFKTMYLRRQRLFGTLSETGTAKTKQKNTMDVYGAHVIITPAFRHRVKKYTYLCAPTLTTVVQTRERLTGRAVYAVGTCVCV